MAIFMVFRAGRPRKRSSKIGAPGPGSVLRAYRVVHEDLMHGLVDGLRGVIEHPAGDLGERGPAPDDGIIRTGDQVDREGGRGNGLDIAVVAPAAPGSSPGTARAPAPGPPATPAPSHP